MTIAPGNSRLVRSTLAIAIALGWPLMVAAQTGNRVLAEFNRASQPAPPQVVTQPIRPDRQVRPTGLQATTPNSTYKNPAVKEDHRLLAPPTSLSTGDASKAEAFRNAQAHKFALPKIESFTTAGAGLAIVVGLFLVCMWLLKRSGPKATSALPNEAVSVLGRVPLAARNFAHLLQVGNKLVLVAITPDGVAPITEITDPMEVQRMLGLCAQTRNQSTSADFHDVLKHLTKEPAKGFLGNEATGSYAANS